MMKTLLHRGLKSARGLKPTTKNTTSYYPEPRQRAALCILSSALCFLLSVFFLPSTYAQETPILPADPASFILTLSTISRGRWQIAKEIHADQPLTFAVPRVQDDPITCTYAPLSSTSSSTLTLTPLLRGGTALTLGTVSCPGFNLSDFEKKNLHYEEAQYIESPVMLPSQESWLSATGRATHLIYDRNIANIFTSFRITFRRQPIVQQEPPEEVMDEEAVRKEEELKQQEEKLLEELRTPDLRGKFGRKRTAPLEAARAAAGEKRRLQNINPCSGLTGDTYDDCVRSLRTPRSTYLKSEEASVTTPVPGQLSRRMQALEDRKQNKMSPLLDKDTGGTINLTPLSEQILQRHRESSRAIKTNADSQNAATKNTPIIRKRATTVRDRRMGNVAPVCRNRVGINLINCLQELGVEISERTVDENTLKMFEEMQKKEATE